MPSLYIYTTGINLTTPFIADISPGKIKVNNSWDNSRCPHVWTIKQTSTSPIISFFTSIYSNKLTNDFISFTSCLPQAPNNIPNIDHKKIKPKERESLKWKRKKRINKGGNHQWHCYRSIVSGNPIQKWAQIAEHWAGDKAGSQKTRGTQTDSAPFRRNCQRYKRSHVCRGKYSSRTITGQKGTTKGIYDLCHFQRHQPVTQTPPDNSHNSPREFHVCAPGN